MTRDKEAQAVTLGHVNALLERYKNDPVATGLVRSLGVMLLTPQIVAHLMANDPQALKQAREALTAADVRPVYRYSVEYAYGGGNRGNAFIHAHDQAEARERFKALYRTADIESLRSLGPVENQRQ